MFQLLSFEWEIFVFLIGGRLLGGCGCNRKFCTLIVEMKQQNYVILKKKKLNK